MTFHGKENEPKAEPEAKPLRTYTYETYGGKERSVEAHFLTFTSGHVNFWQTRPDDQQDTLILSEANTNVHSLKEVTT